MENTLTPFKSISEVESWFKALPVRTACSVLIDFTDIDCGFQKRTVYMDNRGYWIIGFPLDFSPANETRAQRMRRLSNFC